MNEQKRRESDPIIERMSKQIDKLHDAFFGNGNVGMKTLVDRNTTFRKIAVWVLGALLIAFSTAWATGLFKLL